MKTIMKTLAVAGVCGLAMQSCDQGAAKGDLDSVTGTWIVISVDDNEITDSNEEPIITIDGNGGVQGTLGCNSMHSTVKVDFDGKGTIKFEGIGSTKKLCRNMEVENATLQALEKVCKYSLTTKSSGEASGAKDVVLQMKDDKGKTLIEAVKLGDNTSVDAMMLLRGEWVIYSVGQDTLVTDVTLPFIVDPASESVNGHTGRNSFGGTMLLKGAHGVSFPVIASTGALGDDEQNERESLLMKALNNTSAWKEDSAGRVHFTDSLGHTLFVIER